MRLARVSIAFVVLFLLASEPRPPLTHASLTHDTGRDTTHAGVARARAGASEQQVVCGCVLCRPRRPVCSSTAASAAAGSVADSGACRPCPHDRPWLERRQRSWRGRGSSPCCTWRWPAAGWRCRRCAARRCSTSSRAAAVRARLAPRQAVPGGLCPEPRWVARQDWRSHRLLRRRLPSTNRRPRAFTQTTPPRGGRGGGGGGCCCCCKR